MDEGLTIAETAERTGLTAHTLRYYERVGLLGAPERGDNGHRRYRDGDLERIHLVTRLRATGMKIADVRHYFELAYAGRDTVTRRKELLLAHRARVAADMAQLEQDLALIDHKIGVYEKVERERK